MCQNRYNLILTAPALLLLGLDRPDAPRWLRGVFLLLVVDAAWLSLRVLAPLYPSITALPYVWHLDAVIVATLFVAAARAAWAAPAATAA